MGDLPGNGGSGRQRDVHEDVARMARRKGGPPIQTPRPLNILAYFIRKPGRPGQSK
jgi:hypothetical protein